MTPDEIRYIVGLVVQIVLSFYVLRKTLSAAIQTNDKARYLQVWLNDFASERCAPEVLRRTQRIEDAGQTEHIYLERVVDVASPMVAAIVTAQQYENPISSWNCLSTPVMSKQTAIMMCLRILIILFLAVFVRSDGCGGLFESDGGALEIPDGVVSHGSNCVWILKLLTGSSTQFTLNSIGNDSILSLYPEHESTDVVLNPIRLDATHVGSPLETVGQTLIVILTGGNGENAVYFSWEAVGTSNATGVTAASYADNIEGRIIWSEFNKQEKLLCALSLDSSHDLELRSKTSFERCDLIDPCRCSYLAVYEVTPSGYLSEATRVCGRPSDSTFQDLYSQLVAFVYVNSSIANSGSSVEIGWVATEAEVPVTTTTEPTTSTSTLPPPVVYRECGGLVSVRNGEDAFIEYKLNGTYDANEFCIWVIKPEYPGGSAELEILDAGFESCCDGIMGFYTDPNSPKSLVECTFRGSLCSLNSGTSFITFSSDASNHGTGFRLRVRVSSSGTDRRLNFAFYDQPVGSTSYPNGGQYYTDDERLLTVIQTMEPNYMEITRLDVDIYNDHVIFFTVYPFYTKTGIVKDGQWNGYFPDGVPSSLSLSKYPRVILFVTDYRGLGFGFTVNWGLQNVTLADSDDMKIVMT